MTFATIINRKLHKHTQNPEVEIKKYVIKKSEIKGDFIDGEIVNYYLTENHTWSLFLEEAKVFTSENEVCITAFGTNENCSIEIIEHSVRMFLTLGGSHIPFEFN